jgi:malonyl-CoA O-methyltransferase
MPKPSAIRRCFSNWESTPPEPMRADFARAAATYDAAAVLASEVGKRMAERLDYVKIQPAAMADIGCATGDGIRALTKRYPAALPLAIDVAAPMLTEVVRRTPWLPTLMQRGPRAINADVNRLPLKHGALGLVWSNLMLHWLDDPALAFAELHRTLATEGLLTFSMLGPDTLKELRAACQRCGIEPPLRRFLDMHDVGDLLVHAGFADPVMDMEMITLTYAHPRGLLRDQRQLGVRNALLGHLPWRDWRKVFATWAADKTQGRLPVSFEIVYGHAWKPQAKKLADGRAIVRFEQR